MNMNIFKLGRYVAVGAVVAGALLLDGGALTQRQIEVSSAEALRGRPATPISYAGVARRTTRRTVARTSVYVASLPRGCSTVVVNGVSLSQCGGVYYQPYGGRYVVVNVY
jgi:hypothetical protein